MKSILVVFSLVTGLLAGCVSVSGPGLSPGAATPTLGITTPAPSTGAPSASAAPTTQATASPTLAPTASAVPSASASVAPTDSPVPTESASLGPTPSSGSGFDTRDLLFDDTFDDEESGWGVGNTPGGDIAYVGGALQFDLPSNGNWIWSRRDTGEINGTVRMVGEFYPASDGRFGILCISGAELYGAILDTSGGYSFVRIGDEGAEELSGDESAGLQVPTGTSTQFVLECAGLATGAFRMQLWLTGTGPVAIYESDEGPENFDRVGAYVEASSDNFVGRLEQIHVFGVTGADGQRDEAGQELWSHVPADFDDDCYQSPVPVLNGDFATANLVCFLGQPGTPGFEVLEYSQFESEEAMEVAYQLRIDTFGTGDGTPSCRDGSGEHSYTIDEPPVEVGRVLCVEQEVGIRFDWTDDRLNILASGVDFEGSFSDSYDDWVDGGPNL